jgi:hypothetical protein
MIADGPHLGNGSRRDQRGRFIIATVGEIVVRVDRIGDDRLHDSRERIWIARVPGLGKVAIRADAAPKACRSSGWTVHNG